jgi:hypothetical protein
MCARAVPDRRYLSTPAGGHDTKGMTTRMSWIRRTAVAFALAGAVAAAGCSKSDTASSDASAAPDAAASTAPEAVASTVPEAVASTAPEVVATDAASPGASPTMAALTDISGVNGEHEIAGFATLGVVDPVSGTFDPGAPIKRRDFIRWLVKANNVLWSGVPSKRLVPADKTETSAFPDVPSTDPDFPYVQGMKDAGYSVGFPDKTFKPDEPLTREQMFAIKDTFDRGGIDPQLRKSLDYARNTALPPWKDKASISKTYVVAIASGLNGAESNFGRVYGASELFHPQKPVTRAQAAVLISVIGDHVFYGSEQRTLAQALAASPAP